MADPNPYAQFAAAGPAGNPYAQFAPQGAAPAPAPEDAPAWGDVPTQAAKNLLPSMGHAMYDAGKAVVNANLHPIDFYTGLYKAAAGAASKLAAPSIDRPLWNFDPPGTPLPPERQAERSAKEAPLNAIGEDYKKAYGTDEALRKTLAKDPGRAVMDMATVLSGGQLGLAKTPGVLGKAGTVMGTMASYMDPLSLTGKAAVVLRNATGKAAALGEGLITGTGPKTIENAFEAGVKGGEASATYTGHRTGTRSTRDMVDIAKRGEDTLRQAASADYEHGMAPVRADPTVLPFSDIDSAMTKGVASVHSPGGHPIVNAPELGDISRTADIIDARRNTPLTVAEAIDLGKAVRNNYPSSPDHANAKRVNKEVQGAVDSAINAHNPRFGEVNADFASKKGVIDEIAHELSLPPEKLRYGTAARKVGQAFSGNAVTGNRAELVQALVDAGATNLPYAIAGEAHQAWLPRGLSRVMGPALAASVGTPMAVGTLGLASPRVAGNRAHGAGRTLGSLREFGNQAGVTGTSARMAGEGAYQGQELADAIRQYKALRAGVQ